MISLWDQNQSTHTAFELDNLTSCTSAFDIHLIAECHHNANCLFTPSSAYNVWPYMLCHLYDVLHYREFVLILYVNRPQIIWRARFAPVYSMKSSIGRFFLQYPKPCSMYPFYSQELATCLCKRSLYLFLGGEGRVWPPHKSRRLPTHCFIPEQTQCLLP